VRLELDDLPGLLRLVGAPPDRLERARQRIRDGERDPENTRIAKDARGEVVAAVNVVRSGDDIAMLHPYGALTPALLAEAVARARAQGARDVGCYAAAEHLATFLGAGFRDMGERVEFRAAVAELPTEEGTPLDWRMAGDRAAAMLRAVAEGDPHGHDEREAPERMLRVFLGAPNLQGGPECVQIGSLDGADVALVCAQAAKTDGWCRITYMGLVPEARGRGLGRWVHRHGFAMMRAQGGTDYRGGTAAENTGMMALFAAHGCREVRRGHNLELRADGPAA